MTNIGEWKASPLWGPCQSLKLELERIISEKPVNERAVRRVFHNSVGMYAAVMTVIIAIGPAAIVGAISAATLLIFIFMNSGGIAILLSLIYFRRISEEVGHAEVRYDENLSKRREKRLSRVMETSQNANIIRQKIENEREATNTEIKEESIDVWNNLLKIEQRYWWKGCIILAFGFGFCLIALLLHVSWLK